MTKIEQPWDTLSKVLMRTEIQALASLVLPGVRVGRALDKELKIKGIEADFFFYAMLNGLAIILHIEFQKKNDSRMARRMWEYNAMMDIVEGVPVYSILIYFVKDGNMVGSPYVRKIAETGTGHHFIFHVIKLWEMPPEVLKQMGFEGLLPFLPFTKGGKNRETVDEMITELVARGRSDLLSISRGFAGLILTDEGDQQWLEERFSNVLMNLDILKESWTYQKMVAEILEQNRAEIEKERAEIEQERAEIEQERAEIEQEREKILADGCKEGRQLAAQAIQALQQAAIGVVVARFSELEQFAREVIPMISDLNRLQALITELNASLGQEHARRLLILLGPSV
jgi:hypothetical protein